MANAPLNSIGVAGEDEVEPPEAAVEEPEPLALPLWDADEPEPETVKDVVVTLFCEATDEDVLRAKNHVSHPL